MIIFVEVGSPKSVLRLEAFLEWQVIIGGLLKDSLSWRCH